MLKPSKIASMQEKQRGVEDFMMIPMPLMMQAVTQIQTSLNLQEQISSHIMDAWEFLNMDILSSKLYLCYLYIASQFHAFGKQDE